MNVLIMEFGRTLYYLSLLPATLCFFTFWGIIRAEEPQHMPLFLVLFGAYCGLGYLLLAAWPRALKAKLLQLVAPYKARGFTPQCEVVSSVYDRYLGFDPKTCTVLFAVAGRGADVVGFDKINGWEIEGASKGSPPILRLLTRIPTLPVIRLGLPGNQRRLDEWAAHLRMMFGF